MVVRELFNRKRVKDTVSFGCNTRHSWAAQPRGVRPGEGDNVPPTFEAKGVQGGTMKTIYSSQFRLYSDVRQGSILFHLLFNIYTDELICLT